MWFQVSTEAASLLENILLLEHVGPIVLCLIAGPFSDRCAIITSTTATSATVTTTTATTRYGRKLPLLLSCLGMSLAYGGYGALVTLDPKHR